MTISLPRLCPIHQCVLHQNVTCCVKCPYRSVGLDPQQLHMALITNKVIFLLNVSQWRRRGLHILSCSTAQTRGNSFWLLGWLTEYTFEVLKVKMFISDCQSYCYI